MTVLVAVATLIGMAVLALVCFQDRLIYFPRGYPAGQALPPQVEAVTYRTTQGPQTVYLRRPVGALDRLWVICGGNGGLALEWSDVVRIWPNPHDALLLIDYPGYGACAGSSSPASIAESLSGALAATAARLGLSPAQVTGRLGVVGHSLGAAVALQLAAAQPGCDRVVLLAPFTSLRDMARRVVGWPLCWLLRHDFDNRAAVRALADRRVPPHMAILHGDADETIPVEMGRQLRELMPAMSFQVLHGAGHQEVLAGLAQGLAAVGP